MWKIRVRPASIRPATGLKLWQFISHMASEEAVVTPTAGTGLFAELSATPRRAITEPDYIYLEQSMLDWLRAFKGSIARADYGPRIINAGWDRLAYANFPSS